MPKAVANKLIALQRSFMWCTEDGAYGMPLVKWEVVQAPKKAGGLGVGDAVVRNAALLFKWWWRFSKEECPLWKKVVCSCNNLDPSALLSSQILPVKGAHGKISVLQSETLLAEFTSYSFTQSIWGGLVPPRIELFGWFVLVGRVNTKERLSRLGVIPPNDNICALCKKEMEIVHHLFLVCEFTWKVWCAWLRHFDRQWAVPGTMKELFESWIGMFNRKVEQRMLLIAFFTVIWNIWRERNDRTFNNREAGAEDVQRKTFLSYKEWSGTVPLGC
ncbi:uncharacterized protein [Arachis hypogaea]|uniref:uncharacterized protein n=1 Tax=Arachis hypogaea TaxID=3818 RepID=UPI003B21AF7F